MHPLSDKRRNNGVIESHLTISALETDFPRHTILVIVITKIMMYNSFVDSAAFRKLAHTINRFFEL